MLLINYVNIQNAKYYLIENDNAILQTHINGKLIMKDTLANDFSLLAIYRNHKIMIPVYRQKEVSQIKVVYDRRIFKNSTRRNYKGAFRWFNYLFKKS